MLKQFFLSVIFFIFFITISFYIYYLYKYSEPENIDHFLKYYPKDIILQTGKSLVTPEKRFQHFLNFSTQKRKGIIRIGTFGDSYTFGIEADRTETYPYQLQQMLNNYFPNKKVEVLNFGRGGAGFQEQFFLWKKYSKKMGLDYFLLGPEGVWPDRDTTFRKDWWLGGYPKNRFILTKQNKLKQVNIKGRTWEERYKNYYRLIPSEIALYYDREPFKMLETSFPFLKRKITNPFYYTKMPNTEEASRINTLLLKQIKQLHDKKILFFTNQQYLFEQYQSVKKTYNVNWIKTPRNRLYTVFDHGSSLYNEYVAKTYFNALLGEKSFFLKKIHCYFTKNEKISSKTFDKPFSKVSSIKITDRKNTIFTLRYNFSKQQNNNRTYNNHKINNTKSFIAFFSQSEFLESPFFPVSIGLKENMRLYLKIKKGSKITLGKIKPLDSHKKVFVFYQDYIQSDYDKTRTFFISYFIRDNMPSFLREKMRNTKKSMELFIEDHKVGTFQLENSEEEGNIFTFLPTHTYKKSFLMMGASSGYIRESNFAEEFPLYLHYNMNSGETVKSLIPDWRCKKEKQKVHLSLPNFEALN